MAEKPPQKERTCFVIMPIADTHGYEAGHFGRVYEHLLKPAIIQAGYKPIRADDTNKTDYIVVGIIQHIIDSEMVLCDFSARNSNVMYELGIRHAFNKPVTLIKDRLTEKIFDIQGLRYTEYDHALRIDSVKKDLEKIAAAITETASGRPEDVNSVIKLAGLRPADLPVRGEVSGETQLIMAAINSIEQRVAAIARPSVTKAFFVTRSGTAILTDERSEISPGESLYDGHGNEVGVYVKGDPEDQAIILKRKDGKILRIEPNTGLAQSLTTIPF